MLVETTCAAPARHSGFAPDVIEREDVALPSLTADNLRQTLLAEGRVAAVLCGAAWAATYRRQRNEIAAVRATAGERFGYYLLDVLREEELAGWVRVRALPTTLIVRQGRIVTRFAGLTQRRQILSALTAAAFPEFA